MIVDRTFNFKQFLYVSGAFILFTIIGAVSHELGHLLVAESRGYETTLHYANMDYDSSTKVRLLNQIYAENKEAIKSNSDFPGKTAYDQLIKGFERDQLLIVSGGPLQTVLTSLLGFLVLLYRQKTIHLNGLRLFDWLAIFLSLFSLREIFNLIIGIANAFITGSNFYFVGDERNISEMLNLPLGTIPIILAAIGSVIAIVVVFRIIPLKTRLTFIASGFAGSLIGFGLWIYLLGPIVLP